MTGILAAVPEDPEKPGYDVLGVGLAARGHYIHEVLARATEPITLSDIAKRARELADAAGYQYKTADKKAFEVTGEHLRQHLRDKTGYAEQLPDKRWQLTEYARQRIAAAQRHKGNCHPETETERPLPARDVRTVDAKSRVLLPKEFANATVTIEMVSPTEIRIQKAIVIPESAVPFMEEHLAPLSDRDRDFFLNLLDNPPEPTPAFRAAVADYKKRHGY